MSGCLKPAAEAREEITRISDVFVAGRIRRGDEVALNDRRDNDEGDVFNAFNNDSVQVKLRANGHIN